MNIGQPKRHLLTVVWSVFVSSKRLCAGETLLFCSFMNIVIINTVEVNGEVKNEIGMVVLLLLLQIDGQKLQGGVQDSRVILEALRDEREDDLRERIEIAHCSESCI
ncbi:hypothetical protein L1987_85265 [Smallanthus sonchifolius]|uniref:Uncharacterized protein n=1 Tax=Smallanthus sonchifolius TaxID=185202 RepID=A0ACB8XWP5_9ASTR|nr:hypothetical protein L1987_85265 [Smallanthus sonchifolius]